MGTHRRWSLKDKVDQLTSGPVGQSEAELKGGSIGEPDDWLGGIHFQVSGLGSREPGTGYQVRVRVRA